MKSIVIYFVPFFLSVLLLVSCNKSDSPVTPVAPGYGTLKSKIHPRTEHTDINSTDTVDYADFNIAVTGTSYSMVTDTSGKWTFAGLPEGKYIVSFSKPGYSEYKLVYATVTKDDTTDYPVYMYKLTSARISNVSYSLSASQIAFNYKLNVNQLRQYYLRFYFSPDSTVGTPSSNYSFTEYELLIDVNDTASVRNHYVDVVTLLANGMAAGTRVYCFGNIGYKNQYYNDSLTGRKIYNTLSTFPSAKMSFILP
ncbi:MAG: carboxypeptidase-like regulatory domain-containing protein [Ignavibacteria bacterium]